MQQILPSNNLQIDFRGDNAFHRYLKYTIKIDGRNDREVTQLFSEFEEGGADKFHKNKVGKIPFDYMTDDMKSDFPKTAAFLNPNVNGDQYQQERVITKDQFFQKGLERGNIDIVKTYLEQNSLADPATETYDFISPIEFLLDHMQNMPYKRASEILELLVVHGGDVNVLDKYENDMVKTVLFNLIGLPKVKRDPSIIINLIAYGINCSYQDEENGNRNTPLHNIIFMAERMLKGDNDERTATALMKIAQKMATHGSNVNLSLKNSNGRTAYDLISAEFDEFKPFFKPKSVNKFPPVITPSQLTKSHNAPSIPEVFDPIMYDNTDAKSFLENDSNNIIFITSKDSAVGFDIDSLKKLVKDSFYFECKAVNHNLAVALDLVEDKTPYVIIPGNQNYYVPLSDILAVFADKNNRVFELQKIKELAFTASILLIRVKDNLNYKGGVAANEAVSADHCQEGSQKIAYKINIYK